MRLVVLGKGTSCVLCKGGMWIVGRGWTVAAILQGQPWIILPLPACTYCYSHLRQSFCHIGLGWSPWLHWLTACKEVIFWDFGRQAPRRSSSFQFSAIWHWRQHVRSSGYFAEWIWLQLNEKSHTAVIFDRQVKDKINSMIYLNSIYTHPLKISNIIW